MKHVLFGHKNLGKRKTCFPRILDLVDVKIGETELVKAFLDNKVR